MAIGTELKFAALDELNLDPMNPRLGRNSMGPDVSQEKVLELMRDWTLDELAVSYLESGGFWTHEALLVTEEERYGAARPIVIEGNRRLAALIYLKMAYDGELASSKWREIAQSAEPPADLFTKIPHIEVGSREEIYDFLGFRHVTGIKQWRPTEKAQFIAKMIDNYGMNYVEVMRKIGSKTQTVRQNYISYRLLLQIEDSVDTVPTEKVEERFSVLYLSLRTQGVRKYLHIDIKADPSKARTPVPEKHLKALGNFALWLFGGDDDRPPLFTDSRQVDNFGVILESPKATDYLERAAKPKFEVAFRTAGGDEAETIKYVEQAADNVELALSRVHLYKESKKLRLAVERFGADAYQLLDIFPKIKQQLNEENK